VVNIKILITGHKGLIGSELYKRFKDTHEVDGVDRGDNLQNKQYDLIIHCAANCIIRDIIQNPELALENVNYTCNLMEFARRNSCKKVVMFSSSRVHHPEENPYTVGKKYNEAIAKAYKECYGIDYIIVRPETVWGANDNPVRAIPVWINNALNNKSIMIYGDESKEMPPVHITDFADRLIPTIHEFAEGKNEKDIYTITGSVMKVGEMIDIIKKHTNSQSEVIFKNKETAQPQQCIRNSENDIENKFEQRFIEHLKWIKESNSPS